MILTPFQEDAIKEIGNIGVSKAAKQLSLLLHTPIKISIPKITLVPPTKFKVFQPLENEIFSFVYQKITEGLEGYAALAFKREQTNLITMAVLGKIPELTHEEARACEQEALLEIGNIIISSCITAIVDILAKKVSLNLPIYDENEISVLLTSLVSSFPYPVSEVLVISTTLETTNDKLSGNLFLMLNEESTHSTLATIERLFNENN